VLQAVSEHSRTAGISLTSLAAALGMSKSTVLRLIIPLRDEGLVHQDRDSGRYRLGPSAARLGVAFVDQVDLDLLAADLLRDLARRAGERVLLVLPRAGPGTPRSAGTTVLLALTTAPGEPAAGSAAVTAVVRDRGWWAEFDDTAAGFGTVAAPVRDHRSRPVAAVEASLPRCGLRGSAGADLFGVGSAVRECAALLSDRLGAPRRRSDFDDRTTS
jgi:DNA-binding IclR family transcriptional regulator